MLSIVEVSLCDIWLIQVTTPFRGQRLAEGDAFIGYQKDTPAAVVFQATNQLKREGLAASIQDWASTESVGVLGPTAEEEEKKDSHIWKENVSSLWRVLISVSCVYNPITRVRVQFRMIVMG